MVVKNVSKIVVELATGKKIGYVLDVCIDWSLCKRVGWVVVDDESENEFFVSCEDVKVETQNFVFVEKVESLQFDFDKFDNVIGKIVFDENLQNLGKIETIEFDNNKCIKFVTDCAEVLCKHLKFVGEDFVFVDLRKRKKIKSLSTISKKDESAILVVAQQRQVVSVPGVVNLSENNYLGKICVKDVIGYNNERVVCCGQKITKEILENVKKHNKLNQLFFSIK